MTIFYERGDDKANLFVPRLKTVGVGSSILFGYPWFQILTRQLEPYRNRRTKKDVASECKSYDLYLTGPPNDRSQVPWSGIISTAGVLLYSEL